MFEITMDVAKKANGKHEKIGDVKIYVPSLDELGLTGAKQAEDKEGKPVVEDGLPVYVDDRHNWVLGTVYAAVKAQARNRLVPGSVDLRDGATIADTVEALIAEGERGAGSAAALAIVRELKTKFAAYVAGLGKSQAAQAILLSLFGSKVALATQSQVNKEKFAGYLADFADKGLDADLLEKGARYIQSLLDICEKEVEAEDF